MPDGSRLHVVIPNMMKGRLRPAEMMLAALSTCVDTCGRPVGFHGRAADLLRTLCGPRSRDVGTSTVRPATRTPLSASAQASVARAPVEGCGSLAARRSDGATARVSTSSRRDCSSRPRAPFLATLRVAPSTRPSTFLSRGWPPGSWARAAPSTVMWSTTVVPGRSTNAGGSPVPWAPGSQEPRAGRNLNPRLNVGAAACYSRWAPTRVASTSMTSGADASAAWSGRSCRPATALGPGPAPGRDRPPARPVHRRLARRPAGRPSGPRPPARTPAGLALWPCAPKKPSFDNGAGLSCAGRGLAKTSGEGS